MTTDELTMELLGLPARSRAMLAERLLASLEEDSEEDVDAIWAELAAKRAQEVHDGDVEAVPAKDVLRAARARLQR